MGKCLIITGGDYAPVNTENYDYIIACDKGYEYACRMGIRPDTVIGDFDSFSGTVDNSLNIITLPAEKDDTDTMYAVRHALSLGHRNISICCALGGRLDHTIANIQTAAYITGHGGSVCITGTDSSLYMIRDSAIELARAAGAYISIFSYSGKASGVTLRGLKYGLEDAVLTDSYPLGVSNEWKDDNAFIEVKNGVLCIIISKK